MKKIVKICTNEWKNENRDKKELHVAESIGFGVTVIAKGNRQERDNVDGFNVIRLSTRPLGKRVPNSINRIFSLFTWAWKVRRLNVDVISGHDISGLFIGYLSNVLKRKKAKLIYDSHEFELGRAGNRNKTINFLICYLERFLINKSEFSIVVNDSIADELVRIHKLKKRPVVARNIPMLWDLDENEIKHTKLLLTSKFKIENPFVVMYHGVVAPNRGIEMLFNVLSINPNIVGVVLGNALDSEYLDNIKQLAKDLEIDSRLNFVEAVPIEELYKYVGAADIGLITIPNACKSYYYMLPNKFFENIQSLTPIICSNFPEVKSIVEKYQIGLACNPHDIEEVNNCIEKMRSDKKFYSSCKTNLMKAKKELCWENERDALSIAYQKLIVKKY